MSEEKVSPSPSRPFKVIVVGCGPNGLAAAHMLSLAGIDFTILERSTEPYRDNGATFVLWPHGLRLLAQLGLWPRMQALDGAPNNKSVQITHQGKVYHRGGSNIMEQLFGSSTMIFPRYRVLREMHDALSDADKARIHYGVKVADVHMSSEGVHVKCEDGTVHEGSIVIGADGIYSTMRRYVREIPLSEPYDKETPFQAEFKCLWFAIPREDEFSERGKIHSINGKGTNIHVLPGTNEAYILLYEVLKPVQKGRVKYTEEDIAAFVEKWGHLPVTEKVKLEDAYKMKTVGGMTNLDEGVLETAWHRERMVLVGDSKHKMTPHLGLGFMNGMHDVAVLTNLLRRALHDPSNSTGTLTSEQISSIFRQYEETRRPELAKDMKMAMSVTRLSAWHTPIQKFLDRRVTPIIPNWLLKPVLAKTIGNFIYSGQTLDFVEAEEIYPKAEKKYVHKVHGHAK